MQFFKRWRSHKPRIPQVDAGHVLSEVAILHRLDQEVDRTRQSRQPLLLLRVTPQLLDHQRLHDGELQHAGEVLYRRLRLSDCVGVLGEEGLLAILPETDVDSSNVVVYRVSADLAVMMAGFARRNWRVGAASFPADGRDTAALLAATANFT